MLNYFNFRTFQDQILITNEAGEYSFLSKGDFELLIRDQFNYESEKGIELQEKSFIYQGARQEFFDRYVDVLHRSKAHLLMGTSLHIFVLTTGCNLQCIYCQAQTGDRSDFGMMSFETAERAVDFALQSPGKYLTFEFQGGEPLLNFSTLRHLVVYAEENKKDREIQYCLVSNLICLNEEILQFIKQYQINVSTSLDGDESTHNYNRPFHHGGDSYQMVVQQMQYLRDNGIPVGAIQTTSQNSLKHAQDIVDAYVKNGLDTIFLRPLTPLGCAAEDWKKIGYTPEQFVDFYKTAFSYIINVNKSGIRLAEGHASILLSKILGVSAPNYMELRSPCGATLGQIAYYYNGEIYTCDEGRMLGEMGNDAFHLGNVYEDSMDSVSCSPICKAVMASSFLESIPECCDCVYHPYCGTCPVLNLALEQDIFPKKANNYKCKIYKGILDILFEYLEENDRQVIDIFISWVC